MRVLFVTRKFPPRVGGMESLSHGLLTGFPEPKTTITWGGSQAHLVWFLPYVFWRVAFSAHRYDVIHLGDAMLSAAGFLPRLFGKKVAISVHGLDLTFPLRIYQLYLKLFLKADAIIANSESTRKLAEARGLSSVRAISIGVPERYFALSRESHRDLELEQRRAGRVALVTVGRLVPRKGAAWFVRHVLPRLSNALYIVVGVGAHRDEIVRAAAETGMTENVWLVGSVSDARLLDLLGSSDVFVMPNIVVPGNVEGFGIVAIEASASGLPIVASRLEGIPDAVIDGANGQLVPPEDSAAFVAALSGLVADSELRRRLGESGRAYTEQHYSWPRIIAQYRALFEQLSSRG
ncbi:MAG TPA: glycosyltransferase family 4 protein [Polyangiaceae bacterium]|nr:glycosyltransferase family 4 protein [Polyangiaceae bacterium]